MADEREEVLELDQVLEDETPETEQPESDTELDEEEDGETVIGFEGEEEAAPASDSESSVIREFRKREREKDRRIAELERQVAPKPVELGPKPTIESCEWDDERFEEEFDAWKERKAQVERQEQEKAARSEADQQAWQKRLQRFEEGKSRLARADFEDAEAEVTAALPVETKAIILATDKSAELVYALSRSPAKLAELSKLDPLQAALAIGELKGKLQVTKRKLPEPDRAVIGNAAPASADKQLAKLEKEAERTGERTALIAYRKKLKARA